MLRKWFTLSYVYHLVIASKSNYLTGTNICETHSLPYKRIRVEKNTLFFIYSKPFCVHLGGKNAIFLKTRDAKNEKHRLILLTHLSSSENI